jgi:hypothetical protein
MQETRRVIGDVVVDEVVDEGPQVLSKPQAKVQSEPPGPSTEDAIEILHRGMKPPLIRESPKDFDAKITLTRQGKLWTIAFEERKGLPIIMPDINLIRTRALMQAFQQRRRIQIAERMLLTKDNPDG